MPPNRLLAATLLLACVTPAAANTIASDGSVSDTGNNDEDVDPASRRVEGRLGWLVGGSDVGDADGFAMGIDAGLGYRRGDVTFRAVFDYFRVGDGGDEAMARKGRSARIGGAVRYSFAHADYDKEGITPDFWIEGGLGWEHVMWRRGGVLDRPSGELAIGIDADFRGDDDDRGRRRHIGYSLAFRSFVGQGPEMDTPAVCGGPCTRATKPSRMDVSMFFELGLHWGR